MAHPKASIVVNIYNQGLKFLRKAQDCDHPAGEHGVVSEMAKANEITLPSLKARGMPKQESIGIGELARSLGVSLRTLRFYEDRGLLKPRRHGSARLYTTRDKTRLEFILRWKQLGFTLNEIGAMIAESDKARASGRFKPREEQIRAQIAYFERQKRHIEGALSTLRTEILGLDEAQVSERHEGHRVIPPI